MKTIKMYQTLITFMLFLLLTFPAIAQENFNVTQVGEIYEHWSNTRDIVTIGTYSYVATNGLKIIDISDPLHPIETGSCLLPQLARGVAVSGDYAYVADYEAGLYIIDITDPFNPVEVGHFDIPYYAYGVAVQGDLCYVAGHEGLTILNVSDPAHPVQLSQLNLTGSQKSVEVSGDYVYISGGGLWTVDISDPNDPFVTSHNMNTTYNVAISGGYVYAATYSGLIIFDLSDPASPDSVGFYDGGGEDVAVEGRYAYFVSFTRCSVIDISDPTNPWRTGYCDDIGVGEGISVSNGFAYIATQSWGINIVQVTDPEYPTLVSQYENEGNVHDVAVSGDYAYVADGVGLGIVDISDPANPVEISHFDSPGNSVAVAVFGDYAIFSDSDNYLTHIINASDPANPVEVSVMLGYGDEIVIQDNYAYCVNISGMFIIDISNPANPFATGGYSPGGDAYGIAVSGSYAYVVAGLGFTIIDVSNPSHPVEVSSTYTGCHTGVDVSGDYAYLAGCTVMDISNPALPVVVSWCATSGCSRNIDVSGDYAYVLGEGNGLSVVDISDPLTPFEVGYYDTYGCAFRSTQSNGYIYVADGSNLGIYQHTPSNVDISLTPAIPYIQIPANGGSFDFNIEVTNYGSTPQTMDVWTLVTLPDGSDYGPIINFPDLIMEAGFNGNRERIQQVPASAPYGLYYYHGYIGVFPDIILSGDTFYFVKGDALDGSNFVEDWKYYGEDFGCQEAVNPSVPSDYVLLPAYPNPFNPTTKLDFALPAAGKISLTIYDITGREVAKLVDGMKLAGSHQVVFDAKDLTSGVYFARLEAGEFRQTRKILLVK